MISIQGLVWTVVWIIVAGLIFYLLHWAINYVGLPEPFNKVARVVLVVLAVLVLISILLNLAGVAVLRP